MPAKTQNQKPQTQTEPPTEGGTSEMRRAQGARAEIIASTADGRVQLVKVVKNGREFYNVEIRPYQLPMYGSEERVREVIRRNFELMVQAHVLARQKAKELGVNISITRFIGNGKYVQITYMAQTGQRRFTVKNVPEDTLMSIIDVIREADKRENADNSK